MNALVILAIALVGAPLMRADRPLPQKLTLKEAQRIALQNHPQVAIADLRRRIAEEDVNANRAAYFPSAEGYVDAVRAGSSNTRLLAGGLNNPVIYDRVAEGVAVDQLITDFGQTRNLLAKARLSARAETEGMMAADETILLNLDVAYFRVLATRAVLKVAEETVRVRESVSAQVEALGRNQLKSDLDVNLAEVAVDQGRLLLQSAQNDESAAEASLSEALGYSRPKTFELADVPLPDAAQSDADDLIGMAMEKRPDVLRLKDERDAAGRYALAQKDRNYPTVAAVGAAGNALSHDERLQGNYAAGGITMTIPLFEGGAYKARQRQAELQAQVAEESLRELQATIARDVRLAWLNLTTARQGLETTERLLEHARKAYSLAQARYKVGSSSIVELGEAQLSDTSAEIAMASARYDALIRSSILAYQMGILVPQGINH